MSRRRDVSRIARARAPNPVLGPSELSGRPLSAPHAPKQLLVDLTDQSQAKRKIIPQNPLEAVVHRADVVRRLADVLDRHAGRQIVLEEEEVRERRLRSLNLRRQDRFFTDVRIEDLVRVGKEKRDAVQPAESLVRSIEEILRSCIKRKRRIRRKGPRMERKIGLSAHGVPDEAAGAISDARQGGCFSFDGQEAR